LTTLLANKKFTSHLQGYAILQTTAIIDLIVTRSVSAIAKLVVEELFLADNVDIIFLKPRSASLQYSGSSLLV